MSIINDKIDSAQYIYSANTKWGVKKYVCDVKYFTEEPLDDLYYIICSILDSTEYKCCNKRNLGILLGFSMVNQEYKGQPNMYYDIAEVKIFEDILEKVEQEHLIKISEHDIILTELGRISLKEGKHYQFFTGTKNIYEHSMIKSENPMAMLMFPFYKDMGIYTSVNTEKQIWPEDEDIKNCIYFENSQLKKRLELQSQKAEHIYFDNLQKYFDIETIIVPVKLFKYEEEYIPVIMNGDNIAIRATELICEELNSRKREDIVLECLFKKLWDDKSAILNFDSLKQYFDLVDFEELTKDTRTDWSDSKLFDIITDRATPTCWRNVSRHCDIDILRSYIYKYKDNLDWPILTGRIDDSFLIENFLIYPWDLEVLSEDLNRKESVIEQLILLQKDTEEDWNWEKLDKRLSENFVLSHLDVVKVNLASYTNDNEFIRKSILLYDNKRWDWNKIEEDFDLQFIFEHIETLGSHFSFIKLFDRIFTDSNWANKFTCNILFQNEIEKACDKGGALASSIFNDKNYLWSNEIIDLLIKNELLCWSSTPYMTGFECNPYLKWTKDFFKRYSSNVTSEEGIIYLSSHINDIHILVDNSVYRWDWNAISANKSLLSEMLLFTHFGKKLNWDIVFANQKDASFLQSINGIETMIGNNPKAWSSFSSIASINYVISKYKDNRYPWDWSVLTERMFKQLKLEKLGNKLFVDKWDWTYLSKHVSVDFLNNNLKKFSKYWDWGVCLPRILTSEKKFDYDFLDNLAIILTNICDKQICKSAWTALTTQYSFKELKKLIKETSSKKAYWWDLNYFCLHKDFYIFRDLEECRNIIDWNILSCSPSVDASLKFNPKLGIKERAWKEEVKKIIVDERNNWNYASLSHFENLREERWFISRYKDKVDWEYLSQTSKLFCTKDKQQLNEIIEVYKKYINFKTLSEREDVDIRQIIKIYPNAEYNYNKLLEKGIIRATIQLVEGISGYAWDWKLVTSSATFFPNANFLLSHINCEINWEFLSKRENLNVWADEKLIIAIAQDYNISNQIDWYAISALENFPITEDVLSTVPKDKLNWKHLSGRKSISKFIDKYLRYIDWTVLSENKDAITIKIEILNKYKDYLDWNIICHRKDFIFSNNIIDTFPEYIDWNLASSSKDIKFSKQFVDKYEDKWNWPVLVKNKAFNNTVDVLNMPYVSKNNIINFISKFPRSPKAYHFTHMENAIKIIRSTKLQSRNFAQGNFSNSAGSNVQRTNKAHRFARFYFVPKSPTQFYNECLGKDRNLEYYDRAYNLGLPKCPLPVFFIFDIEELLTVMPELCYYSNGNMQKDSSQSFKVTTDPNRIKAKEIYIQSKDTFDERQQEFLIEGELDFSKLRNVQICCYNNFQAEMLRNELKGTKWENVITSCSNLFIQKNRELFFSDKKDSIKIYTNYGGVFEFRISYSDVKPPTILNKNNVLRQRGKNIYMSSSVEIKKDIQFEIYFEVNSPRPGSWLVYKNK